MSSFFLGKFFDMRYITFIIKTISTCNKMISYKIKNKTVIQKRKMVQIIKAMLSVKQSILNHTPLILSKNIKVYIHKGGELKLDDSIK